MTGPTLRMSSWLIVGLGALLVVGCSYLTTWPDPYGYIVPPLAIGGAALLIVTMARPLWLFPIVAPLSLIIYAVPLFGAQVIAADLVVACILLAWIGVRPRRSLNRTAGNVMVPLAALIVVCLITLPGSQNTQFGLVKIIQRVEFLAFLGATAALLRDRAMMRRTLDAYILGCVALALVTLLFALLHGVQYGGINLLFYNKNSIAAFLAMGLPLVVARLLTVSSSERMRWVALALILSAALVVTGSRGAWLGAVISAVVLTGLQHRAALARYLLIMAVLLLALNTFLPDDLTRTSEFNTANLAGPTASVAGGGTVLTRLVEWRDALTIIAAHPLLGVGVGGYVSFDTYLGDTLNFNTYDPHNSFLYMWAELGTGGLIVFVWLLLAIFRVAIAARRASRGVPGDWLASGCLAAIISYLIFTLTEPIWVRGDGLAFFLLVGIAINLASRAARSAQDGRDRETIAVAPPALLGTGR